MSTAAPEIDSLGSLEERIRRIVDLVATLRAERETALAERDSAIAERDTAVEDCRIAEQECASPLLDAVRDTHLRWPKPAPAQGTRGLARRAQTGSHAHRKAAGADGSAERVVTPMEPDRKTVRVTIYNQSYTLTASASLDEVESLAHSVDTLMTARARHNVDGNRADRGACFPASGGSLALDRTRARRFQVESRFKIPPVFPFAGSGVERPRLRRK